MLKLSVPVTLQESTILQKACFSKGILWPHSGDLLLTLVTRKPEEQKYLHIESERENMLSWGTSVNDDCKEMSLVDALKALLGR